MRDAASALKSFQGLVRAMLHAQGPQRELEQRPVQVLQENQRTRLAPRPDRNLSASLSLADQGPAQAANAREGQRVQAPQPARHVQVHRPDPVHRTGWDHLPGQGHRNDRDALSRKAADPAVLAAAVTPSS